MTTRPREKHGMHTSAEYGVWEAMKQRCLNPKDKKFPIYGGRGIGIHSSWLLFSRFFADMGPRPGKGYTIERLDNNKGYKPGNCQWRTYAEQNRNYRRNVIIEFRGKRQCLMDWSIETGINWFTLWNRLFRGGWGVEETLTLPATRSNKHLRHIRRLDGSPGVELQKFCR